MSKREGMRKIERKGEKKREERGERERERTVVYFYQQTDAWHANCWMKSSFSQF